MMDYQKAYIVLFNGITDTLAEFDKAREKSTEMIRAIMILQCAQWQTENMYIEAEQEITQQKPKAGMV